MKKRKQIKELSDTEIRYRFRVKLWTKLGLALQYELCAEFRDTLFKHFGKPGVGFWNQRNN